MTIQLREASPKDIDDIYKIFIEFDKALNSYVPKSFKALRKIKEPHDEWSKKALLKDIRKRRGKFYLATKDEHTIGYIYGYVKKTHKESAFDMPIIGIISDLAVKKTHRGQGVASKLYQHLMNWLKSQGCSYLELQVLNGNPAQHIYEKWGFTHTVSEMHKKI